MFLLSKNSPKSTFPPPSTLPSELTGSVWTMQNLKLIEIFLKGVRGRKSYKGALAYCASMLSGELKRDPQGAEYAFKVLNSIRHELESNPRIRSRKQLTELETRNGLHRDWKKLYEGWLSTSAAPSSAAAS